MPILQTDDEIKEVLEKSKNIAVVGISNNPAKPSYFVSKALQACGYKLFLINPKYAGQEILGEKVYKSLLDIEENIDVVDVFRRPADVKFTAEEALKKGFKTFWFQPGTYNEEVAKLLDEKGYNVVIDKCMKVECIRLKER